MLNKCLKLLATVFILSGQCKSNSAHARHNTTASNYKFEYQTSYNGIVLTMKDELIA